MIRHFIIWVVMGLAPGSVVVSMGAVLWSHPGTVLVCDNGNGEDILQGAIAPHDSNSSGTLYFRVMIDPISDTAGKVIKNFEAGFMLVENGVENLGIGNAGGAMAYSALHVPKAEKGFQDLNSQVPDLPYTYEYMRAGLPRYLVFKVEYVPGHDARVTAWLNPNLAVGATEFNQPSNIVVRFEANAAFDEFRLIHRGYGGGWKFSRMLVATSFEDLLMPRFWQRTWFLGVCLGSVLLMAVGSVQLLERRRALRQIHQLERERAVATERARIAQDIHDEVGTSLTKISKLTELMHGQDAGTVQQDDFTRAIAHTAQDTIRAMDEIVWAINPRNDALKEMADYLVYFTEDFLRPAGVECVLDVPLKLPDIPLPAEVRHNLFMAVKEALNNAVRHASPSRITLGMSLTSENQLTIEVSDDGRGFEPSQAASVGNGLENMRRRMEEIRGRMQIQSESAKGTRVSFKLSLSNRKHEFR